MIRRPPSSTRTDTLFPYTTLCRSVAEQVAKIDIGRGVGSGEAVDLHAILDRPVAAFILGLGELDGFHIAASQRRQRRGKLAVADRGVADRLHRGAVGEPGNRRAIYLWRRPIGRAPCWQRVLPYV